MGTKTSYFFLISILMPLLVNGNYILRVQIHNYNNLFNRCTFCGSSGGRCCDSNGFSCSSSERCDNEFFFCLRPFGAALVSSQVANSNKNISSITTRARNLGCLESPPAVRSSTDINDMFRDFSSPLFLGLPNPLEFPVVATRWAGIQLYVDVVDRDSSDPNMRSQDELVNVFQPTIQIEAGLMSEPATFNGLLQFSSIQLSFQAICQPGFSGPTCLQDPEFTTLPPSTSSTEKVMTIITTQRVETTLQELEPTTLPFSTTRAETSSTEGVATIATQGDETTKEVPTSISTGLVLFSNVTTTDMNSQGTPSVTDSAINFSTVVVGVVTSTVVLLTLVSAVVICLGVFVCFKRQKKEMSLSKDTPSFPPHLYNKNGEDEETKDETYDYIQPIHIVKETAFNQEIVLPTVENNISTAANSSYGAFGEEKRIEGEGDTNFSTGDNPAYGAFHQDDIPTAANSSYGVFEKISIPTNPSLGDYKEKAGGQNQTLTIELLTVENSAYGALNEQ